MVVRAAQGGGEEFAGGGIKEGRAEGEGNWKKHVFLRWGGASVSIHLYLGSFEVILLLFYFFLHLFINNS